MTSPLARMRTTAAPVVEVLGRDMPRLWTRPLVEGPPGPCGCGCALSERTSLGFECLAFAVRVLGVELLGWQRWWMIHALELQPGTTPAQGRYRFSTLLTLVSRQNGKTVLLKIVALWCLYMGRGRLVLGAAQDLKIARESWQGAVDLALSVDDLAAEVPRDGIRYTNGEQCLRLISGARYMITAANRQAGRGLSVDLLILDELREQRSTDAWAALGNTTMARPYALTVGISNQGDDQSVVLNTLRAAALAESDDRLAIFEWSAPDGCDLDDLDAWAQANPGLGRTITAEKLRTMLATTSAADFRTENLCQRVDTLDAAIDPTAWAGCADTSGSLATVRNRIVLCVDVAPDGRHVTLAGAALLDDGRVRVELFGAWTSTQDARRGIDEVCAYLRPRALGWYPSGPAAVLGVELQALHGGTVGQVDRFGAAKPVPGQPGVTERPMLAQAPGVVELAGQAVTGACQTLADLAEIRGVLHPADPLLNAHVAGAQRLRQGDGWRFARRDTGHVDAAYAAAGAVHLARSLPPPAAPPRPKVY